MTRSWFLFLIAGRLAAQTCATVSAGATCDLTADLTSAVSWNSSAGTRCTINAHNYKIDAGANAVTIKACDVNDLGHTVLTSNSDYAITVGTGTLVVDNVSFSRSNGINRAGNSTVTVTNSTWLANSTYQIGAINYPGAPGGASANCMICDSSAGSNTITLTGNKILGGGGFWVRNSSSVITDNIMIGPRVRIESEGSNSVITGNYMHTILPVTCSNHTLCATTTVPVGQYPYWADQETFNLGVTNGTQDLSLVAHDNVIRTGQWVARHVNGDFYNNVVVDALGHSFINGISGKVHSSIFAHKAGTANGYYLFRNSAVDWDSIPAEQGIEIGYSNNAGALFYNNTIDETSNSGNVIGISNSVSGFGAVKNTVISGIDRTLNNSHNFAAIGPYFDSISGVGTLTYANYNLLQWVSSSNTNYGITVPGTGSCGANDQGTCNVGVNPQYQGTDGSGTLPNFFPFLDSDISSGTVTVAQIIQWYQYVYGPHSGSPLLSNGNNSAPTDGTTIGAVQSLGSNPFPSPMAPVPDFSAAQINTYMPSVTNAVDFGVLYYLDGYAAYDGRSGALSMAWTYTGPGTITFSNQSPTYATGTGYKYVTASFSASGTYTVRLTATAGALSNFKEATIVVGYNPHPRIWYTSSVITSMQAKVAASDPDWCCGSTSVKTRADGYAAKAIPNSVITSCTAANPVVCTVSGTLPIAAGTTLANIGGATGSAGSWADINHTDINNAFTVTKLSSSTFSVPINGAGFGSFSGQTLKVFWWNVDTGYVDYSRPIGDGWDDMFELESLAYLATGTTSYCTNVNDLLQYIIDISAVGITTPIQFDSGFVTRTAAKGAALGFDNCYAQLSSPVKAGIGTVLDLWQTWVVASGYQAVPLRIDSNYSSGHVLGMGLLSLASAGDATNAQTDADYWAAAWASALAIGTTIPADGTQLNPYGTFYSGNSSESYNYGGHTWERFMGYQLGVLTATNNDIFGTVPQLVIDGIIYNMRPDRVGMTGWGDWAGGETVWNYSTPIFVAHVNNSTVGNWAQWVYQNRGTPPVGTINQENGLEPLRFAFYSSSRTATDPAGAHDTNSYRAGGMNIAAWRDSWSTSANASWATFASAFGGPHASKSGGSVAIYRGADAMIPFSGSWKGTDGWSGSPSDSQYNQGNTPAFWWSTLFFYDGNSGPYCQNVSGPQTITSAYYGCQMPFDSNYVYSPTRTKDAVSTYQYVLADISHAYDNPYSAFSARTLRYYLIDWMVLADGFYAVQHRALTTNSTYDVHDDWWFSPQGTPASSGGTVSNVVNSSKVWVTPVLPASATIGVTQIQADGTGNLLMYNATVSNPSASTGFNSLTAIVTASSGATAPVSTALSTIDSNFNGLQIVGASINKVAIVAKDVTYNSGPDSYTSNTHAGATFTTTHSGSADYLVAGITPGTVYSIASPCATGCSGTVGTDSTIHFTGTSGAYTIGAGSSGGGTAVGGKTVSGGKVIK